MRKPGGLHRRGLSLRRRPRHPALRLHWRAFIYTVSKKTGRPTASGHPRFALVEPPRCHSEQFPKLVGIILPALLDPGGLISLTLTFPFVLGLDLGHLPVAQGLKQFVGVHSLSFCPLRNGMMIGFARGTEALGKFIEGAAVAGGLTPSPDRAFIACRDPLPCGSRPVGGNSIHSANPRRPLASLAVPFCFGFRPQIDQ